MKGQIGRENVEILFRKDQDNEAEFDVATDVWGDYLTRFRSEISPNTTVIGRYSVLPYYNDLYEELERKGSRLINSKETHCLIKDMKWVRALSDLTPDTWFDVGWKNAPDREHGWVVKGRTNSRKFQWRSHMRAEDRDELREVMTRLRRDTMIGDQGLAVREYVPLEKVGEGINGLPFANEWRCFYLDGHLVDAGFYWSVAEVDDEMGSLPKEAKSVADEVIERWAPPGSFLAVDVAKTEAGEWILVEINSGQMAGLSMIEPERFYRRLFDTARTWQPSETR